MEHLISKLDRWKAKRIIVVGDFILDRFVYGNAERLSPDAPVPVLAAERREQAPGGAANVCLDLAALGCRAECVGVVGRDLHAGTLKQSLKDAAKKYDGTIGVAGLVADPSRPTTVKHNLIGLAQHRHPQKMFRVDDESKEPVRGDIRDKLFAQVEKRIANTDVLCLEDYNKGVLTKALCQSLIRLANKHKVPVLVDPAAIDDYSKYTGATAITPNRTEAAKATGVTLGATASGRLDRAAAISLGTTLLKQCKLQAVVLTLDRHGLLLLRRGKGPIHVPTRALEVYDVTGAGDMVLAMLAAALAQEKVKGDGLDDNPATWSDAIELANVAAGLEVARFGIIPITLDEVLLAMLKRSGETIGKARTLDQLLPELRAYRRQNPDIKIAFTNGCFDILHAGHVAFLRDAKKRGDLLVVGLNSDKSIGRIKSDKAGPSRPVNHEADRVMVLSELQSVDYIVVFGRDTPIKLIEAIRPNVLVKGADYKKHEVVGHEVVEAAGGSVALVPLVKGRSTTNIIRKAGGEISG